MLNISSHVDIYVIGPERQSVISAPNHLVARGRDIIRDLLSGRGPHVRYIALGTSAAPVKDDDIRLGAEIYRREIDGSYDRLDKIIFARYIEGSDGNASETNVQFGPIRELGLCAANGDLIARAVISHLAKSAQVALNIMWHVGIGTV